jgi:hypothetical protein
MARPSLSLVLALTLSATSAFAEAHPAAPIPPAPRAPVEVHHGFPIRRAPVPVFRPYRRHFHVYPRVFLPLVIWPGVVVVEPPPETVVWAESDTLLRADGWSELAFGVPSSGRQLMLDLEGRTELDFAEVIYADGSTQVVDFARAVRPAGGYVLADLDPGRAIDHLRLVGRATDERVRVRVRLVR